MTKIGYCHQCKKERKELHRKSHIISRFMFERILGEDNPQIIFADPKTLEQTGSAPDVPYDQYIFCKECEKFHTGIESKASQILFYKKFDPNKILKLEGDGIDQQIFKEANADTFKKFLLLILWRAHISDHKVFKEINLGPYAEKFRKIINRESVTTKSNCQFYIFNFRDVLKNELQHFCTHFFPIRIDGRNGYSIFIDGVGYLYHFGKPVKDILNKTNIETSEGLRINLPHKSISNQLLNKLFQIKDVKLV